MKRGRPKAPINATDLRVRLFFEELELLGLSLSELTKLLQKLYGQSAPSYRTLQEWRRGTHSPHYAPLENWLRDIQETVADNKAN
jgi:hypothetical protein